MGVVVGGEKGGREGGEEEDMRWQCERDQLRKLRKEATVIQKLWYAALNKRHIHTQTHEETRHVPGKGQAGLGWLVLHQLHSPVLPLAAAAAAVASAGVDVPWLDDGVWPRWGRRRGRRRRRRARRRGRSRRGRVGGLKLGSEAERAVDVPVCRKGRGD